MGLIFYRIISELVCGFATLLHTTEKIFDHNLFPSHWRLRERLGKNWSREITSPPRNSLWLHAASLGESKGVWGLAQALSSWPGSILITTNTETGFNYLSQQIANTENPSRWKVSLAPLDHPRLVKRFLFQFKIQFLVLFEMELWPHFILAANSFKIPVMWVSARMTKTAQKRLTRFPKFTHSVLSGLTFIHAQDEVDANVIQTFGVNVAAHGGDLKALTYLQNVTLSPSSSSPNGIAFLSWHVSELPTLLSTLKSIPDLIPVYVFPRRAEEWKIFAEALSPFGFSRYSNNSQAVRLCVDSFGLFGKLLPQCHAAVIGGSFVPRGGHNLWEPMIHGLSLFIGPYFWKQEYLVRKLMKEALIQVLQPQFDSELLLKRQKNLNPAYREFFNRENLVLHSALQKIRHLLGIAAITF